MATSSPEPGGPDGRIAFPHAAAPAAGEAIEVAEGVLWAGLPMPFPPGRVNVYALDDGDGWTLVDTGIDLGPSREAWARLLAGPLAGRLVRRVIATHHHPDHIGLAGWFQAAHGAELLTTRTAWLFARMLRLDEQDRPAPETLAFWRGAGMPPHMLEERAAGRPFNFADVVAPMPLGFTRIGQDDRIAAGGRVWRVEVGHGHAPEHATLWSEDDALVLAGDQVLPGITPNLGVYATEPEADPVGEWLASCRRLAGLARPEHVVLPGHKLPFTGLAERLGQLIGSHEAALDRLERHLDRPRTAVECFPALYRREIGAGEYGLALGEAVAHLNRLGRAGRAAREPRPDGAWAWRRASRA